MIIILIITLTGITTIVFLGPTDLLKDTPYVASSVEVKKLSVPAGDSLELISLTPLAGDDFHLAGFGSSTGDSAEISIFMTDPQNIMHDTELKTGSDFSNVYGNELFIYNLKNQIVIDSSSPKSAELKDIVPFEDGIWTLTMVDGISDSIIYQDEFTLSGGINLLSGTLWTGENLTTPSGAVIPVVSDTTTPSTGPEGMSARHFDGDDSIYVADDDAIDLSGDMTISLWMDPSVTTGYHNILGKGASDNNDNYDLFIINQEIWFEWNDAETTPNEHRHIKTDSVTLAPGWSYLTLVVKDDIASIYVDTTESTYKYYKSNLVNTNVESPAFPVNMEGNSKDLHIGQQEFDESANYFYYEGDIGDFAFYDRALTTEEINSNFENYQA